MQTKTLHAAAYAPENPHQPLLVPLRPLPPPQTHYPPPQASLRIGQIHSLAHDLPSLFPENAQVLNAVLAKDLQPGSKG
jgi:hypothetical protein